MPFKNASATICIKVFNTNTGAPQTGDAANITVRGVGDGSEFTPSSPSITEVDSTNLPGIYKVSLTASENNYSMMLLGGKSSTASCVVSDAQWTNEKNANLAQWLGSAPNALSSGRVEVLVGAVTAGVIAAASFAANALDAVWSTATRVLTAATNLTAALATPTNITAGTITNVTNLTNAPTNGDLTSTMKTSVQTAADAAITANAAIDALPTNAELATALGTADDAVLAQLVLVRAKTDNLPGDPADASDIASSFSSIAATLSTIAGYIDTEITSIASAIAGLNNLAAGAAMTLTAGERAAIAAAILDLADAIETGLTMRQAQRLQVAALAGKISGAATTTVAIRNAVADSKARITATVDADGNRTAVTTDVS